MGYTTRSLYSADRGTIGVSAPDGSLYAHKLCTELKSKEKEAETAKAESEKLKGAVVEMQKEVKRLRSQMRLEKSSYENKLSRVRRNPISLRCASDRWLFTDDCTCCSGRVQIHERLGKEHSECNEAKENAESLEKQVEEVSVRLASAHAKIAKLSQTRSSQSS